MSEAPLILYVDDEKANRVVFEKTFGKMFRIECFGSASSVLSYLEEHPASVIITDQRMPEMGGNELLEIVKTKYPQMLRLVMTAYGDLDPILRAVNHGLVARYVIKPWDRAELEEMLRWAVQVTEAGERDSELQVRLLKAERLMTIGSIHAAVLHDVNQPLSYMVNNTERLAQLASCLPTLQVLLDEAGSRLPRTQRRLIGELMQEMPEIIDDLATGCRHLGMLTRTVRTMLQSDAVIDEPAVDPMQAINFALSVCRQVALRSGAVLTYQGPDHLPAIDMGSTGLIQTLINLMSNAAQSLYEKEGGRVVVETEVSDTKVTIHIRDNGPGMTPDMLAQIGRPFFSTKSQGTGLGLHQCKRLVAGAHGTLWFESEPGVGTTVTVQLPRLPS